MQYPEPNANPYGSGSPYDSPYGGNSGMPYMGAGPARRRGGRGGCLAVLILVVVVLALGAGGFFLFRPGSSGGGLVHTGPTVIPVGANPTLVVTSISNPHTQLHIHAGTNDGQITIQPPSQFNLGAAEYYQETQDHLTVIYDLDLNVTGTFDITVPAHTNLNVDAGQANTVVEGITGRMHLETLDGTLTAKNNTILGPSLLRGNSGALQILDDHLRGNVTLDENQANITYRGTLDPAGTYRFSDNSGDITLTLPQNGGLQINASTISGAITSTIPGTRAQQSTPGFTLQASLGGAPRAQLILYNNSGAITLNEQGGLS